MCIAYPVPINYSMELVLMFCILSDIQLQPVKLLQILIFTT